MVSSAQNYPNESSAITSSRFATWISRLPLVLATVIFTGIGSRFLFNPVHSAAAQGIAFTSGGGITTARIGLGAFPLAFALITVACLVSRRRILTGLYTVLTVFGMVLVVRVVGMMADNSFHESSRPIIPELVLTLLSFIALNVELRRRKQQSGSAAVLEK